MRNQARWMEKRSALDKNDSFMTMMQASCISCSDVKSTSLIEKALLYWEASKEPA
jgi:hypothetical protein